MPATAFPPVMSGIIGGALVRTVNGRDLHAFLKIGRDFTSWLKGRIFTYGFVESTDYVIVEDLSSPNRASSSGTETSPPKGGGKSGLSSPDRGSSSSHGGARPQRTTEYHLTIDMAKELSMVENNDQGRAARRYFIECERRAKAAETALPRRAPPEFSEVPVADNRMQMVAECRRIFGRAPARRLWLKLDLPEVEGERRADRPQCDVFGDGRDMWCDRILDALAAADEALDERRVMVRAAVGTREFRAVIDGLVAAGLVLAISIYGKPHYSLSETSADRRAA